MINSFEFLFPTKVRYGEGVLNELPDIVKEYGKKKIFIVTDPGVRAAGLVDLVTDTLKAAGYDQIWIYDQVAPNPRCENVNEGAEMAKSVQAEILIAVGGGSPVDTAKGIGVLMTNEGIIEDYEGHYLAKVVENLEKD